MTDPDARDGTLSFRFNGRCDDIVCPRSTAINGKTPPRTAKTQATTGLHARVDLVRSSTSSSAATSCTSRRCKPREMNLARIPARTLVNARAGSRKTGNSPSGAEHLRREYVAIPFFVVQGSATVQRSGSRHARCNGPSATEELSRRRFGVPSIRIVFRPGSTYGKGTE